MHNIKEIRKDFEGFKKSLSKRNIDINFELIKKLDTTNRELIQKKEAFEKKKKIFLNQRIKVYSKNQKKFQTN